MDNNHAVGTSEWAPVSGQNENQEEGSRVVSFLHYAQERAGSPGKFFWTHHISQKASSKCLIKHVKTHTEASQDLKPLIFIGLISMAPEGICSTARRINLESRAARSHPWQPMEC